MRRILVGSAGLAAALAAEALKQGATVADTSFMMGSARMGMTMSNMRGIITEVQAEHRRTSKTAPTKHKIGRNDPCPCGSGKKYKRCHLNEPSTLQEIATGLKVKT